MPISITVDGKAIKCEPTQTILEICRSNNIYIPTLCFMEGLSNVGACRLCLVEIEGVSKLLPACTTRPADGQKIKTDSEKLKKYRKMTIELFFSERNHVCSVCVANNNCQLQDLAYQVGMTKVRFPYLYQECNFDGSHELFNIDHNRCVLCTRCVRACNEVEGAYNWGVMG
jgi:bidirectional [NiFe] hydrogenase diaphorase subunit